MNNTNIKLRGHETFHIREGWLRKGINAINENSYILSDLQESVDTIGVGTGMVKAIRYWLQALGLTKEERGEKGKRKQSLTNGFGKLIYEHDPYFEDLSSLYLLHYKLVTNRELATSWYLYFNEFKSTEITKTHMEETLKQLILNINPELSVSDKLLNDDCNCIIKTYYADKGELKNPEDNMICPFTDLGLIKKISVLYVLLENLNDGKSTTINNLLEDSNNVGKVFNLNKSLINYYIDLLEEEKYIYVTRTAGLNTIYPTEKATDILKKYYSQL